MDTFLKTLEAILTWQTVAIVSLVLLLNPIKKLILRLIESDGGEAKIGPIEVKLGKIAENGEKAVSDLNKINYVMAESRRLELEITVGISEVYKSLGMNVMSNLQADEMQVHIRELKLITENSANKQNQTDT